ncbi:capping protein inhibiting regulator of actin dynamics isoform X1 [Corythoichthys intestinalis]|uniref:capping protein inhibiting regulator of actin dynamics isoform X1 n=2 Tax=Corythoichthys intestinalis TaxID=161448 RepID=UPI0025A656C4|nr:capping protein inhibiting regulator of actin dynamics isoform X1 [Corythoichthys intestinalis]
MFPKVLLQWCAALSSCAAQIEKQRRQGKFQPFRRLFGKKKQKREAQRGFNGAQLKTSFSTGEVCNGVVSDDENASQSLRELNPVGPRSLSHDSIFIPEESAKQANLDHTMSQENVSDKVKNLQKQIAQTIKFGQKPPSLRRSEGDEESSDEETPQSPLRVMAQVETEPEKAEPVVQAAPQTRSQGTPIKSPRSKRVLSPGGTIESVNLDAVPQSVSFLDNSAAKHKLSVKPKNQRVSRKHRRFTQDSQEVSIPGVVHEDQEVPSVSAEDQRKSSTEDSLEAFEKRLLEEERLEEKRKREVEEEERRQKAERLRIEEEERCRKREKIEEEKRLREEEERRMRKEEERRQREEEERKVEEARRLRAEQKRKEEEEAKRQQELEAKRLLMEEEEIKKKEAEKQRLRESQEKNKLEVHLRKVAGDDANGCSDHQERKRRAEELRWREMEERQKPFSFQVSSGEKEILFPKVNLSPVTATAASHGDVVNPREETKASSKAQDSPNRQISPYVPHTAILVTGAQLCGTAVNLDQIRDTACKSLLGLGEDRKTKGTPPVKTRTSPDRKSAKTKSLTESIEPDPESGTVLAEWATIRSKIFKGVEEGSEYPDPARSQPQTNQEDQHEFAHTHLRKTISASAKFSITPAKKKFGDSKRNSDCSSSMSDDKTGEVTPSDTSTYASPTANRKARNRTSKNLRIAERGADECVFAKDLPSFLVPCPGAKTEGNEWKARDRCVSADPDSRVEGEELNLDSEDKPSPFGIKLRRTNYSLRFHSEQSTEKRKKRYSAGDSFDGVPSPLTPIELDSDASPVFSDRSSPASPQKETNYFLGSASPVVQRANLSKSPSPAPRGDGEHVPSKPSLYRRPAASPKLIEGVPTPPLSPLSKASYSEVQDLSGRSQPTAVAQLQRSSQGQGDEDPKEKRSFFPSINIPWREKVDRKSELIKKEKPSLQSRHSLDSARVQEKEAGPLWITLALQKQKGFREQQQNREDRRSQREAKLAEKQSRERDSVGLVMPMSPTESQGGSGSVSPGSKALMQEEPKRPDSLLGRFERREQLKKANTLPSSVTVEIADSSPSPPAVKEVSKRFTAMDSTQVSTEPAWLALAKRKAKAWSDCPQIIK